MHEPVSEMSFIYGLSANFVKYFFLQGVLAIVEKIQVILKKYFVRRGIYHNLGHINR